jgi:adenine-specific DNA-methyltransferase
MKLRDSQAFLSLYYDPKVVELATGTTDPFTRTEPQRTGRGRAKSLGQVFTPPAVAEVLARWVISKKPKTVLDPAVGIGHLLYQCWLLHPSARYLGIERDLRTFRQAVECAPPGAKLIRGDYLRSEPAPTEAIIANPPYVKAHNLGLREPEWRYFEERFGTRLDRLTNLYGLFLLKIWEDLAPSGRAAVIVPAEFLNANFGTELKERLIHSMRPAGLAVFDPSHNVFDGALTTSCILFLEKGRSPDAPIRSVMVKAVEDVRRFLGHLLADSPGPATKTSYLNLAAHNPNEKWLNQILVPAADRGNGLARVVGDYFRCLRGIATGGNDFFCLTPGEMTAHDLKPHHCEPCIAKATDAEGLVFTREKLTALMERGRRCFLFNPKQLDAAVNRYLALGEALGIPKRYLPSHRSVWYLPEPRAPADIWVAVFSRESGKFILNEARVKNLTCFHGLYSKIGSRAHCLLMTLFLNSSRGRQSFFRVNRFYGDGLNKLEPRDVEAMPCPELRSLRANELDRLLRRLMDLDRTDNDQRQAAIDEIVSELLGVRP